MEEEDDIADFGGGVSDPTFVHPVNKDAALC